MNSKLTNENRVIRIYNIILSFFLLCVSSPVIFLTLAGATLFTGFPPVYISNRTGRGGKTFRHYKIRSMKSGRKWGRSYFEQDRLNSYGKFIRRFHLDELPELCLILTGKMSFVGPRPLPPALTIQFDTSLRETVLPGWTGLAQVKLMRRGILFGPEQIKLDNMYVKKRSPGYDFKIMGATITSFFKKRKNPEMETDVNEYRKKFKIGKVK